MKNSNKKSIADRLVSISQPHVRALVRGKAAAKTEFGMKLSLSLVDGGSTVEKMSWYNEGCDLRTNIERYHERYGYYPESVHADKIYWTVANRLWCKEQGIRNAVAGKFGQGKRRFGLKRIMSRLAESSKTVVSVIFLVINLEQLLFVHVLSFFILFKLSLQEQKWLLGSLNRHYHYDGNMELTRVPVAW